MTALRLAAALLLCGTLAGCAGLPGHRAAPGAPEPLPQPPPASAAPGPEPGPAPSATAALMAQAAAAQAAGEPERAAALLERAIRVAPTDPLPWSRLAEVRLAQEQWRLAEQLAARSNHLAGTDPALQARNWRIIARGRQLAGDAAGARAAAERAQRWEEQAP